MNWHNITIQYSRCASFAVPVTRTAFRRERKLQRNSSHPNTRGHAHPAQPVRSEFFDSQAREVNIAGSFNEWRPGSTWMIPLGNGRWVKEIMLPPGRYEYCFVVDRHWMPDSKAAHACAPHSAFPHSHVTESLPCTEQRDRKNSSSITTTKKETKP